MNTNMSFHQSLTHSWCFLLNPGGQKCSFNVSATSTPAHSSRVLQTPPQGRERIYLFCPLGSSMSGCCVVNGEHYELFTGHEMTEQSAEHAAHRSQRGERKHTFVLTCSSHRCPQLMSHNCYKQGRFFTTALCGSCQNYVPRLKMKWSS